MRCTPQTPRHGFRCCLPAGVAISSRSARCNGSWTRPFLTRTGTPCPKSAGSAVRPLARQPARRPKARTLLNSDRRPNRGSAPHEKELRKSSDSRSGELPSRTHASHCTRYPRRRGVVGARRDRARLKGEKATLVGEARPRRAEAVDLMKRLRRSLELARCGARKPTRTKAAAARTRRTRAA